MIITICAKCMNKYVDANRRVAYPLLDEIDPVTGLNWQINAHEECININKGNCSKYKKRILRS